MTSYFVTRHKGAVEWARLKGIEARHIDHLDPTIVQEGDRVLGTLPVSVAAEICARGAHYVHLTLETPKEQRGRELAPEDLDTYGARLEEFEVRKVQWTK